MAPFPLLRLPGAWSHTTRFRVDGIKTMSCCINLSTYNSYLPTIGPLQLAIHVVQNGHAEEQKSHWDKSNKGNYQLKLCMFSCLSCPSATFALRHGSFEPHECRAVARFFLTGGIFIVSAEGPSLLGGSGGILLQENFKFGGFEMLFSSLIMKYVSEISTSNKCEKASVFSPYILQVLISKVLFILKHTVYPSTKQIHPQT